MSSHRINEAARKAIEKMNAMTPEELKAAIDSTLDIGIGRMIVESGAHEILMKGSARKDRGAIRPDSEGKDTSI